MVAWEVIFADFAQTQIENIDSSIRVRILEKLSWLSENFDQVIPIPLVGSLAGFYKLRIGDYRVIYSFEIKDRTIYIQLVEHRSRIYRRK